MVHEITGGGGVLLVDFIFRHINSSKSYSGGFLSTWQPNRKSFENQAHFVSLSETSVHYFLCANAHKGRDAKPQLDVAKVDSICSELKTYIKIY